MESLADKYPEIAAEWDYDKNHGLTPDMVSSGMHKKVFWRCPKCGKSYESMICNRTSPSRQKATNDCPVCLGRVIIPGFNSLKAKFPEIVEQEWDYVLNNVDPDTIAPHTNKSYYWKCLYGHESYMSKVNNKVNGNGGNCPKCSHQKFSPEFSLKALRPDLAKDWDVKKNDGVMSDQVFAFSNKSAWWSCHKCGFSWKAKIDNRSNGRGCPNCAKGHHTSFPEQVVFHFVKALFPDSVNGYKFNGQEIDVFIPSRNLGIEYDGEAYHNDPKRVRNDIRKSEFLKYNGIELIRIRESGCVSFNSDSARVINVKYSADYSDLQIKLQNLLDELCGHYNINSPIVVDIESVRAQLIADLNTVPYQNSFAAFMSEKLSEGMPNRALWNYDKNYPVTPEMVEPFSEKEVWWICPNNPEHQWKNTVKSVSLGYGCSKCSGKYHRNTEEWIKAAREIHGDKYDYSQVYFINAKTPVTIICPKHGSFQQVPSEHLSGKGCKFCANQAFHPLESLAVISPEIAAQWDYDLNKGCGYTPETIGVNTTIKFWWHCTNGKPHSFQATIAKRISGMQCAVCHGKQMSYDRSLEYNYPELAREWCPENDKRPSEVSPGSEYKALWKCPNPDHPKYRAMVGNRTRLESGCPLCAREGHPNRYSKKTNDK